MAAVPTTEQLDETISAALDAGGLTYQRPAAGSFLVELPGEHKLKTMCWLVVGSHSMLVEAFFMRKPDDAPERVYSYLLTRNAYQYGVAFSLDKVGDVFLAGRVALHAVTAEEVDRLLGCVLEYSDTHFNPAVELGFGTAIRKEWAWRQKNGENLDNLAPFARFAESPPA